MSAFPQRTELDDDVIQMLYEAAAGTVPWKQALDALDMAVGNVLGSQMLVVDKTTGTLLQSEQPDHAPAEAVLEYVRHYHRIDPHAPVVAALPVGKTIHTAEVFPAEQYANHPFYKEFWTPFNVRSFVGTKLAEDERHVAMIGLMRSLDVPEYSADEVQLAGRYFRHLAAAMRIAGFLKRVKTVAVVGFSIMEASGRPMVVLDRSMAILAANRAARRLLQEDQVIGERGGLIRCSRPGNDRALRSAFAELMRGSASAADQPTRTALRLSESRGDNVYGTLWRMEPSATMGAFGSDTVILLSIAKAEDADHVDPVLLGAMFDLTPAEARLAVALLQGAELAKLARAQRVSIQTLRTHLKAIFAKTGTHRQSDLVRLLLRATMLQ